MIEVIEIQLIDFNQAFEIASSLMLSVAPLSIMFVILRKSLNLFISFVSGGKIEL